MAPTVMNVFAVVSRKLKRLRPHFRPSLSTPPSASTSSSHTARPPLLPPSAPIPATIPHPAHDIHANQPDSVQENLKRWAEPETVGDNGRADEDFDLVFEEDEEKTMNPATARAGNRGGMATGLENWDDDFLFQASPPPSPNLTRTRAPGTTHPQLRPRSSMDSETWDQSSDDEPALPGTLKLNVKRKPETSTGDNLTPTLGNAAGTSRRQSANLVRRSTRDSARSSGWESNDDVFFTPRDTLTFEFASSSGSHYEPTDGPRSLEGGTIDPEPQNAEEEEEGEGDRTVTMATAPFVPVTVETESEGSHGAHDRIQEEEEGPSGVLAAPTAAPPTTSYPLATSFQPLVSLPTRSTPLPPSPTLTQTQSFSQPRPSIGGSSLDASASASPPNSTAHLRHPSTSAPASNFPPSRAAQGGERPRRRLRKKSRRGGHDEGMFELATVPQRAEPAEPTVRPPVPAMPSASAAEPPTAAAAVPAPPALPSKSPSRTAPPITEGPNPYAAAPPPLPRGGNAAAAPAGAPSSSAILTRLASFRKLLPRSTSASRPHTPSSQILNQHSANAPTIASKLPPRSASEEPVVPAPIPGLPEEDEPAAAAPGHRRTKSSAPAVMDSRDMMEEDAHDEVPPLPALPAEVLRQAEKQGGLGKTVVEGSPVREEDERRRMEDERIRREEERMMDEERLMQEERLRQEERIQHEQRMAQEAERMMQEQEDLRQAQEDRRLEEKRMQMEDERVEEEERMMEEEKRMEVERILQSQRLEREQRQMRAERAMQEERMREAERAREEQEQERRRVEKVREREREREQERLERERLKAERERAAAAAVVAAGSGPSKEKDSDHVKRKLSKRRRRQSTGKDDTVRLSSGDPHAHVHHQHQPLPQERERPTPVRDSVRDVRQPGELRIPQRISQHQRSLKEGLGDVRQFAGVVEDLRDLQSQHATLLAFLSANSAAPRNSKLPKSARRGSQSSQMQTEAGLARIETAYTVWWELAGVLVDLGGSAGGGSVRAAKERITPPSGSAFVEQDEVLERRRAGSRFRAASAAAGGSGGGGVGMTASPSAPTLPSKMEPALQTPRSASQPIKGDESPKELTSRQLVLLGEMLRDSDTKRVVEYGERESISRANSRANSRAGRHTPVPASPTTRAPMRTAPTPSAGMQTPEPTNRPRRGSKIMAGLKDMFRPSKRASVDSKGGRLSSEAERSGDEPSPVAAQHVTMSPIRGSSRPPTTQPSGSRRLRKSPRKPSLGSIFGSRQMQPTDRSLPPTIPSRGAGRAGYRTSGTTATMDTSDEESEWDQVERGQDGMPTVRARKAVNGHGHSSQMPPVKPSLQPSASVRSPPRPPLSSAKLALTPENIRPLLSHAKEVRRRLEECIAELRALQPRGDMRFR